MSVHVYDKEEMQGILDRLKWLVLGETHRLHVHVPPEGKSTEGFATLEDAIERVAWALECAWIAQYAAWARTYHVRREAALVSVPFPVESLDVRVSSARPLDDLHVRRSASGASLKQLGDDLGNVLYNAVSNGGTDFCPAEVRELLASLRLQIYLRALEAEEP